MTKLSFLAHALLLTPALGAVISRACDDQFNVACYHATDVIEREVAIIGGGSSGTFAAITLKDKEKSIIVVEKQDSMGGHVQTYKDPASGIVANYGVRVFENTSITYDFFTRVKAPTKRFVLEGPTPGYVDFTTGQAVNGFQSSNNFSQYVAQWEKYPFLVAGNGMQLPKPVPEDLALPFGSFITKHNLQDIAYSAWVNPALGNMGHLLNTPTIYVFKSLTPAVLSQYGTPGKTLASAIGDNHQAFANAQAILGSDVLLSSTVRAARRPAKGSNGGVLLVVQTPSGRKLIKASRVLFTAAETLDNLRPFALDKTEKDVFSQLSYTGFYSGLVSDTGIPANTSYQNVAASNGTTLYQIPKNPNLMHVFASEIPGVQSFWYLSTTPVSDDNLVKRDVEATIARLTKSTTSNTKFLAFSNNSPGILYAPPKQLLAGFWDQMNALQGHRNTYYTGLLFESSSSGLWNFTSMLIDKMGL